MRSYKIDQYFEFTFSTQRFDTGVVTDADALPTYRVYEENNDTVIDSGNTAKRDDANTTGYYYARGQCTAALGYEVGKCYEVRVAATVNSVAGANVVGRFVILPAKVWDSLFGGTDNLEVDTILVEGSDATDTIAAPGDAMTLTEAYDAAKTAAQAGDAMTLTEAYDASKSAAQAGDAMTLTEAYDAAKDAASSTEVGAVGDAVAALHDFDPATDTVVNVTNVAVCATNSDMVAEAPSAATIVSALKSATGFTAGGTWTFAKVMKAMLAMRAGTVRLKSGETDVYEFLDAEDGTTVVATITRSDSSPYLSVVVA